jgi:hypothetical protein
MPIQGADLSIYGPSKPLVPYIPSDVAATQDEAAQAKQAAAQKLQQSALDEARSRQAMQMSLDPKTGLPDSDLYRKAATRLNVSPEIADKVVAGLDTHFKTQAETQKFRDEHLKADGEFQANFIGAIDNQPKLDFARERHPEWNLPQDYATGKDQLALLGQSAMTGAQQATARHEAVDDLQKSKAWDAGAPERAVAQLQSAAKMVANDDPGAYAQAKNGGLKGIGWDQAIIDKLPDPSDPQAPQKIKAMSMTPKDVTELGGQADARAQTKLNEDAIRAQTAKFQGQEIGLRGAEFGLKQKEFAQKQKMDAAQLSDAAIDQAAQKYLDTGALPAMGMGGAGGARQAIMNRAAVIGGNQKLSVNSAEYKANTGSLNTITKQLDNLTSFENTANKNLKQFTDLAAKIPDTGVPWLNTPVRSLSQNLVGSDLMPAVNAARQVALTEISRIVSNPNLTGQLSDSARNEVMSLSPANATIPQIKRVVAVLQQDMQNRRSSVAQQKQDIERRLGATPPADTGGGGSVKAIGKDGVSYNFPNQAAADAFKKAGG